MDILNCLIDSMQDDLIKSVQKLVQIKSVKGEKKPFCPFGEGPAKALAEALRIGQNLGFKTKNINNYVGYVEYGTGEKMIAILGHLDVVPEGTGWDFPPYAAEINQGKIYGRGTMDDKGPILAALYGLKAIKEASIKLPQRVRILFGTNEESGSRDIKYYLEQGEEIPIVGFTPDGDYPVVNSEKGIIFFDAIKVFRKKDSPIDIKYIKGGIAANMVPAYCEAKLQIRDNILKDKIIKKFEQFIRESGYQIEIEQNDKYLILKSKGIAAHAMGPEKGKNAIMQLVCLLNTIDLGSTDVANYIHWLVENIGMENNGYSLGINCKDDSGELTLNLGIADIKEDQAMVRINPRYPHNFKGSNILAKIKDKAQTGNSNIRIENIMDEPPLYFHPNHPLIETLIQVFEEQTNLQAKPLVMGGGTYAKSMPHIVAYGPRFPGAPVVEHQPNEYIKIEDLILNAKIYAHAICKLSQKNWNL
jgi:succinyl-diaminopimelate desuccinylase